MEFEVHLAGHVDEARLRAAVGAALAAHPMARARVAPVGPFETRYRWLVGDRVDDPCRVIECRDEAQLASAREELHSLEVPLDRAPPFRLLLARRPAGDALLLDASHVAADGLGGLRLLRSIDRACAADADPLPPIDALRARSLDALFAAGSPESWLRRLRAHQQAQLDAWLAPPARIAAEGGTDRPGYAFHHATLDRDRSARLARAARSRGATTNDVLLAALTRAIDTWNRDRGVAADRIALMVPLNLRPAAWRDEVFGNFSVSATVSTRAADRADAEALLASIVAQTREVKRDPAAAGLVDAYRLAPYAPALWKRGAPDLAKRLTADRFVPTAVLTNLGRVADALSFRTGAPAAGIWLSPPTRMPMGLGIGVVAHRDALHFSLRCRHPLMSAAALQRFAEVFLDLVAAWR